MWWNIVFRVGYSCAQTKSFEKLCFCKTYQVRAYVFADAHLVTYENRVGKMLKRTSPGKRFSVWQTGSIYGRSLDSGLRVLISRTAACYNLLPQK